MNCPLELSSPSGAGGAGNILFKNDKLSLIISERATRRFWNFYRCINDVFLVRRGSRAESFFSLEEFAEVCAVVVVLDFSSTYSIDTESSPSSSLSLASNSSLSEFESVCNRCLSCRCD